MAPQAHTAPGSALPSLAGACIPLHSRAARRSNPANPVTTQMAQAPSLSALIIQFALATFRRLWLVTNLRTNDLPNNYNPRWMPRPGKGQRMDMPRRPDYGEVGRAVSPEKARMLHFRSAAR